MWFTSGAENSHVVVVPLEYSKLEKIKLQTILERYKHSGMASGVAFVAVDCGLEEEISEEIKKYCNKKHITFCKQEELPKYFNNSTFQKTKNIV